MSNRLSVAIHDRLDSISVEDWDVLFAGHPDSYAMVRLVQSSGMDGFSFHSIVVRDGAVPILLLPLFDAVFDLKNLLDGLAGRIASALARLFPSVMSPRLLGVGFVEGEWGAAGIRPDTQAPILAQAWQMAFESLEKLAAKLRATVTVLLNFTPSAVASIPHAELARYAQIDTLPCGRLSLPFDRLDGYLSSLSKNMRKDLRRKQKAAADLQIVHATDPMQWIDDIYRLYIATVERADMSLGTHRRSYFIDVCQKVPGSEYVLYFHNGQLVAFNLLVTREDAIIDKYFCMDERIGRELNLYFVSWLENVRQCIDRKIRIYHAGPGAEATKARLGATFVPSLTLFRGAGPILHFFLAAFRGHLAYKPAVDLADPTLTATP